MEQIILIACGMIVTSGLSVIVKNQIILRLTKAKSESEVISILREAQINK